MVPESLAKKILTSIGARAVAMKMGNQRRLLGVSDRPSTNAQDIDMRQWSWWSSIIDAFDTLLTCKPDDVIRVVGAAPMGGDFIELVMDATGFRAAIRTADLVLTGEGRIDAQTAYGKTALGVAERARDARVPCIAIGGSVTPWLDPVSARV